MDENKGFDVCVWERERERERERENVFYSLKFFSQETFCRENYMGAVGYIHCYLPRFILL